MPGFPPFPLSMPVCLMSHKLGVSARCTDYRPGVSEGGWEVKHGAAGGAKGRGGGGGNCGASSGKPRKRGGQGGLASCRCRLSVCEPLLMPACLFPTHCPHFSDFFCCTKSEVVLHVHVLTASGAFPRKSNVIYKTTNAWRTERTP